MECVVSQNRKTKVLKKVRGDYIRKKADPNDIQDVDPSTRLLSDGITRSLVPSIGLVENNRKICSEISFLNIRYHVSSFELQTDLPSPVLKMNLGINNNIDQLPWEYLVKRLESYGDLNIAVWAHKIKNFYSQYLNAMDRYFKQVEKGEKAFEETFKKAKERAKIISETIENNYPFHKGVIFANKNSIEFVSASFNESFFKEIGYTTQSFMKKIQKNGFFLISPEDSEVTKNSGLAFLNFILGNGESSVQENPEFVDSVYEASGSKRKVIIQNFLVFDPAPDGVYVMSYYILKDGKNSKSLMDKPAYCPKKLMKGEDKEDKEIIDEGVAKDEECKLDV